MALGHYKASSDLGMDLPCLLRTGQKGVTGAPERVTLSHGRTHCGVLLYGSRHLTGAEEYVPDAG